MAIGSGLGSQFGFSSESVYGTYVAPTKFLRARSYSLEPVRERVQGEGITSGGLGPLAAQYVETVKGATGEVELDAQTTAMGKLLNQITGGTSSSAAQGGTAAYLQTHTLGDTYGKSLTVPIGRPTRAGTAVPANLVGGKITSAEWSCDVKDILKLKLSLDGQNYENTTALATASYVDAQVFHGGQLTVKLGTYSSETTLTGVRSVSQTWSRGHDAEDYTAGASGLKSEPVLNALAEITGSLTVDWLAKATLEDLSLTTGTKSLILEWVGDQISSTYYKTLQITLPSVTFEAASQGVDGVGELTSEWSYQWRYDGTNLPTIKYTTTDTSI